MLKTDLGCKPGGLVQFDGESDPTLNGINTQIPVAMPIMLCYEVIPLLAEFTTSIR